ncbi:dihydrolipoyl dehydrogenase [Clostridium thermarum]|uniref:dihydrolipoyl dehydrogenase n=1 Tax=Clostridium thermarum TaxID=1716543 RepID=UPI0013D2F455|nr:dihydrolipoyl dehydrogenase [Clostridium thermarum]
MDKSIIIIGGGPAGYTAAIRGAQLGAKVTLVEKDELGGTCLNCGCIPTKALYRTAEIVNTLRNIDHFGIRIEGYSIDVNKIHERKRTIVKQLVSGVQQLLKANKVEVVKGRAQFKNESTVTVIKDDGSEEDLRGNHIIIAAGSKPMLPPIPGANLEGIMLSDDILDFTEVPKSLAVIGGGVIGMEFAAIFNALGTKVTVVEYMTSILSMADSDIIKRFTAIQKKKGMEIFTSTKVVGIEKSEYEYILNCETKKGITKIAAEKVLLSVGRAPLIEELNLQAAGIGFDRKGVKVDSNFRTNVKGIYAIGDINGKAMLAHAAAHHGIKAVEHIVIGRESEDKSVVPSCIFTFPEIASVGITEEMAKEQGINYKVGKFLFGANGKALTLGEPEGMVKVISKIRDEVEGENKEEIIGVHIMGPHASDIIHEGSLVVSTGLRVEDVIETIHAHPTLAEAFSEAVMAIKGQSIHQVNRG